MPVEPINPMDTTAREVPREVVRRFCPPPKWYIWKVLTHGGLLVLSVVAAAQTRYPVALLWNMVAASQIMGIYTGLHAASHGHLSKNKRWNERIGVALGMMLGTTFSGYRACHMQHHKYLRKETDPQEVIHISRKNRIVMAILLLIASVFGAAIFIWIRVPFMGAKIRSKRRVIAELCLALAFYSILFVLILPHSYDVPLLVSVCIALVWGSMLDITYHQGLPTSGGGESSRSLECDKFGFWVLNGENRHAEHHAYPQIPGPNLPEFSVAMRSCSEFRSVVYESGYTRAFLKGLFRSPYFLPPPLDSRQ
jgi:fatty acid desaturase